MSFTSNPPRERSTATDASLDAPGSDEAQLLARILEVVPGGIVQVGADGAILRANLQAQRFLGLGFDVLARRLIADFAGATYREDGSACPVEQYPVAQCLATGQPAGPLTIGVRQPSGEVRWGIFTALPFPEPEGEKIGAVVTFVDITERRLVEMRARAHDRMLDKLRTVYSREQERAKVSAFHEPLASFLELTESASGFIASVDPDDPQKAELRLHAFIDKDAIGRSAISPQRVTLDALTQTVITEAAHVVVDGRAPFCTAFQPRVPKVAAALPLSASGKIVGVLGLADSPNGYSGSMLTDLEPLLAACADLVAAVDERRAKTQLEAALAQAERLASVGTLAAGMAHEINNPLAYVLLNLQAFDRSTDSLGAALVRARLRLEERLGVEQAGLLFASSGLADAQARLQRVLDHGRDAYEGAERVQRIVRDLMTFSRVTDEQKSLVDVNAAVEVALKMADHEIRYRARLARELGNLSPVLGNDGRLSQVFLNLLINAARAIEEGHPDENEIRVRTWLQAGEVLIEVSDTGVGVPEAHIERLFEPFFSTRAPGAGAGLGLSICHNVVRSHGGRIDVQSEVGVGTRFIVRLPRAPEERTASVQRALPARAAAASGVRHRILLVDDEPMVLRVLSQVLSRSYDVECADGYVTATAKLEYDARYDVVLCDMMMLDGTGVDVHAWVSENAPELVERMVFMTGGTFTPKSRDFLASAGARHLVKPFSLHELDEMVAEIVR